MKLNSATGQTVANFEMDEVLLFNNVLNEVCNGFTVPNFEVCLGATEDRVRDLFRRIRALEAGQRVRVYLDNEDLLILQNALREAIRELGAEEFSIRAGLSIGFGQAVLGKLREWKESGPGDTTRAGQAG